MAEGTILILDDEQSVRDILATFLADFGCRTIGAETAEKALSLVNGEDSISVALVDIKLPGMTGLEFLDEVKKRSPDTEAIVMTSYASLDTAIAAIRKGAYDYLQKPFDDLDDVWETVKRALEKRDLLLRNRALLRDLADRNEALSAAVKRQNSLIDAGRAMSGIVGLSELLDFFIGLVAEELSADRASLMLLDEQKNELRIAASRGLRDEVVREIRVQVGEGIAGWVAKEGKPILVKDVNTDPRVNKAISSFLSASYISSPIVLSIPILLQEKVMGVINVTNRRSGGSFDEEDMAFLYGLAGQAAIAIERSSHTEELQSAYGRLKTAQKHLVEMERFKALGQMAAGVAHDFNNLLAGMLGNVEILKMKVGEDDLPRFREIETIERLTLSGAETVRRIQDFTRIRRDEPSGSVDLNGVVEDALNMTRTRWQTECEAKGIRIEIVRRMEKVPLISGNRHELAQVACNLIHNAVEAMPEGGTLTIRTACQDGTVVLEISDSGTGMSDEERAQVFEPFFTTKETGQGLGMSIVFGIVARHGGEIRVTSGVGAGTTVSLVLPAREIFPAHDGKRRGKRVMGSGPPARVMVVEDNEIVRSTFLQYLELMGHVPRGVASGGDAIAILEHENMDLLITDLAMPGMSGLQLVERIRKNLPMMPVILISGWAMQQDEPRIRLAGIDHVIQKPCTMEQFKEIVDKVLGSVKNRQDDSVPL